MASGDNELGVKRFCFGDFKCLTCKRTWESGLAWKDFGQECRSCHVNIKPHHIEEAYRYVCKECQIVWRWKWDDEGSECPKCGQIKKTLKDHRLVTKYIYANLKQRGGEVRKVHDQKLCEKCVILGRDCRGSVDIPVSAVMEIAATRHRPLQAVAVPNSQNRSTKTTAPSGIIGSFKRKPATTPVPFVINTADTFKKVTPSISYSAMVTGRNLNSCPVAKISTGSPRIPNGSAEPQKAPISSEAMKVENDDDNEDEDVYGNSAWAAAYKLEQEKRIQAIQSSASGRTRNGKTSNGNGYYYISVPTNGKSYQQESSSWGCNIL